MRSKYENNVKGVFQSGSTWSESTFYDFIVKCLKDLITLSHCRLLTVRKTYLKDQGEAAGF